MWLLLEKILALGLSFFVTIAVARHLLPSLFGQLSFWLALVSMALPISALGLNTLITREILLRPHDRDVIVGSALGLRALAGLCVATSGSLVCYWYLPADEAVLLSLLLFSSIANATLIVDFWLQAQLANRQAALLRITTLAIFSLLRLAAVWMAANISIFVYLLAAEFIVLGCGYLAVFEYMSGATKRLKFSLLECQNLLMDGRWLFFSGLAAVLYLKVDQIMLGLLVDRQAVGIYAVAAKFSEVWFFLPAAFVTAYFPQIIKRRLDDPDTYTVDIQKMNDFLFSVALGLALLVTAIGGWLLPALLGGAYAEAVPILLVHIWASILVFMRALLSKWLIAENLLRLSLLSQMAGALINILLNSYLIPRYGPLGAAYATVLSYLMAGYIVLFLHSDLQPMAKVVNRSLVLPFRLMLFGRGLYKR